MNELPPEDGRKGAEASGSSHRPGAAGDRARELVRRYIPDDMSLVDELIAERRREAEREENGHQ